MSEALVKSGDVNKTDAANSAPTDTRSLELLSNKISDAIREIEIETESSESDLQEIHKFFDGEGELIEELKKQQESSMATYIRIGEYQGYEEDNIFCPETKILINKLQKINDGNGIKDGTKIIDMLTTNKDIMEMVQKYDTQDEDAYSPQEELPNEL